MVWDAIVDFGKEYGDDLLGFGLGAYDAYKGSDGVAPYMYPNQSDAWGTMYGAAQDTWNQGPAQYYPNNTIAERDPNMTAGEDAQLANLGIMGQLGDAGGQAALGLASGGAGRIGGFQLPDQIGFDLPPEYASAIMNPVWDQLSEQVIPGIHTAATAQGAFGGSRMQQQKADATEQATQAATDALIRGNLQARQQSIGQRAGDISAQLTGRGQDIQQNQLYNTALGQGVDAITASQGQQLVPGQAQYAVGAGRTAYDQSLLNADRARWDYEQNADQNLLGSLFGFMSGGQAPPSGGTAGTPGGDWLSILQGGLQGINMNTLLGGGGKVAGQPAGSTAPYQSPT
jgi:hypothetical protein